ncbi:MAG TPA: cytochrome c oxidase assembly protein, partial [Solirubrobacteraceae bacterium]|nr:cytochrome c oxidase assembly protein [Solirubrobacteraceae bacterium]
MTGAGPAWDAIASGWHAPTGLLVLLGVTATAYAVGVGRVTRDARAGRRGRRWPIARSLAFAGGLLAVLVALASGLDARADVELSTHMLQHLLITTVAAPLLVAGAPLSLALQAARGSTRRALAELVRSRAVRLLTAAPVAFAAFAAATLGTHLTGFYDAALRVPLLHAGEHLLYLATAVLFWLPLIGANPVPQLRSWAGRT